MDAKKGRFKKEGTANRGKGYLWSDVRSKKCLIGYSDIRVIEDFGQSCLIRTTEEEARF